MGRHDRLTGRRMQEKMREKMGTKTIQTTAELFALPDKCANAAKEQEWLAQRVAVAPGPHAILKRDKKRRTEAVLVAEPKALEPARPPTKVSGKAKGTP